MVDLNQIREQIVKTDKNLKKHFHQSITPKCSITTTEDFLIEKEEETNIKVPELMKAILLQYGSHRLNFRIPDQKKHSRYICGQGSIYGEYAFEWGGFDRIIEYKMDDEKYTKLPLENSILLEDLHFGKYILLKQKEDAKSIEDVDIILFDYPDSFNKLNVTFDQYFTLLPKTFGMYCWQEYLTDESYPLDGVIPDNFHENMKQLFPEVDLSVFRDPPKLVDSVYNKYVKSSNKVDYRAKFINIMEKLKAHPKVIFKYYERTEGYIVDKTKYTARYGVPEVVLRKIKKDYRREISEKMMVFYYQMDGCVVQWIYEDPDNKNEYIEGKINFLPLQEVMGDKWSKSYLDWSSPDLFKDEDSVYYFNEEEAAEYPELDALMKKARIFDEQGEMRDYFIEFVEGQHEPNIYKVERTRFYKMNIDFLTFVDARIEFAGISGWEYHYFSDTDYSEESIKEMIDKFKEKVLKVLPDADFEKFGI